MPKKKRVSVKYVDHPTSRFDHFMNAFVYLAFSENEEVKSKHRKLLVDKGMQEWRRHKDNYKKMSQEQFNQVLRCYERQNQLSVHELNSYVQTVPDNANRTEVLNSGSPFMLPLSAFSMLVHPGTLTPSTSSLFQSEEDECSKKDTEESNEQSSKSSSSSKKNERSPPISKPIVSVSQPLLTSGANSEGNTWNPFLNPNLAYFMTTPQLITQHNQHRPPFPALNRQTDLVPEQAAQIEEHNETGTEA